MRQYNVWQAIVMSFYSKKLYRDVAINWGGFAFLYLLMIVALSVVYWTVVMQTGLNLVYVKVTDQFVSQIPVLTVKEGKISTPEKRPYLIKDAAGKEVIAVIDTTGKYKTLDDSKTNLLITETEVLSHPKPTQTRIDKIPSNMNFVFEPIVVNEYIKNAFGWAWVLIFPVLVVIVYLFRVIQALFYAVLGRLFGAVAKVGLSYPQIIQVALVSITPVIVLSAVIDMLHFNLPNAGTWGFVVGLGYLFYGVLANKD